MEICPGDYIKELLIHHKAVSLPTVGGFIAQDQSAQLDEGLGKLTPPSKKIIFTPNLAIDDGLLVNYMMKKFGLSHEEATDVLISYCQDVNHALNNKEFFAFKGIGRIYKDFEGKIKFLPDHSNLNEDAFGLPDLDFSPMAQESTAVQEAHLPKEALTTLTPDAKSAIADSEITAIPWWQQNLKWIGLITAFLLLIVYLGYSTVKKDHLAESNALNPSQERTNISPQVTKNEMQVKAEEELPEGDGTDENAVNTDEPTISPTQKVAIIAIGKFGNKDNVRRLVKRIFDEGYNPYQEDLGKLTRVGIQFAYEEESEVYETLKRVRKIFAPDAEILKK